MSGVLVVVVAFLNEATLLPRFLATLDAQTRPPDQLLLVDDGSTDDSPRIAQEYAASRPHVQALHRPPRPPEGDRLATAAELVAFLWGLERADPSWTVAVKLDADLDLAPRHFETVMAEFDRAPDLGIAGAYLSMALPDGSVVREPHPPEHVRGPNKFYRRACWDQIAPLPPILGWDTIDELAARLKGWRTRSIALPDRDSVHLRPTGTYDGALRGFARWGQCAYALGDPPVAVLAGGASRMRRRPHVLGGLAYVYGWLRSIARRDPRAAPEVRRLHAADQRRRMRRALGAASARLTRAGG